MRELLCKVRFSVYIQICGLLCFFLLTFGHTIVRLITDWTSDENYSHGFLVPLVAVYMIWGKRHDLTTQIVNPSWYGLLIVATGLVLHVLGNLGAELFTVRIAMILTVYGLVLSYTGNAIATKLAFPIAYLVFMIPVPSLIWNSASFPLQLLASKLASVAIEAIGIPVLREGNVLHLAKVNLEVVDACSGLRSLVALLALSAAFAFFTSLSNSRRWTLFLAAFPIAIVMNIVRLVLTATLAHIAGEGAAEGFLHQVSGLFTFVGGFALLYSVYLLLSHSKRYRTDLPKRTNC
ncbi:MAG: exosortase/archaeosortase family protein [Smithellaceae bacterium]